MSVVVARWQQGKNSKEANEETGKKFDRVHRERKDEKEIRKGCR